MIITVHCPCIVISFFLGNIIRRFRAFEDFLNSICPCHERVLKILSQLSVYEMGGVRAANCLRRGCVNILDLPYPKPKMLKYFCHTVQKRIILLKFANWIEHGAHVCQKQDFHVRFGNKKLFL
jgi:hypothetical protein